MRKVLIKGGTVIDPKQKLHKVLDVLIEDGKISEIQEKIDEGRADRIIEAEGKIVCPGFVDIHMHEDPYDEETKKLDKSIAKSMILMGVTSVLAGNCGDNALEPDRYLDLVDRDGAPTNVALLAGHTFVRNIAGGTDKYKPVSGEIIDEMERLTKKYLKAGCFGVSFGVKYIPGTGWEEMVRLASLCKPENKIVSSHVRNDVERVYEAVAEMADLAKEAGVRVQISHIGSMGGYGQMTRLLSEIDGYRASGIDMACDCYPYDAFSTGIGETTYDAEYFESYHSDYSHILICDGKYAGKRCTKELFEELRATAPKTMTVGYFMKEEDVEKALLTPYIMVASDGVRNKDKGHPRAAGTFPRFLRLYAHTGKISLDQAIEKMTWMPAERLGLTQKGNLEPGSDADVVIFDYDKICDLATYEEPAKAPEGIEAVLLAGEIAVEQGKLIRDDLGKALRA